MDGETLGSYCVLAPKKPEGFDEIVESGFFKKQVEKAEQVLRAQAKIRRERQLAQMNLMMQPQVIGRMPSLRRPPLQSSPCAFDSKS
jgi:hypothetical protein